jgi:hypothetical protein
MDSEVSDRVVTVSQAYRGKTADRYTGRQAGRQTCSTKQMQVRLHLYKYMYSYNIVSTSTDTRLFVHSQLHINHHAKPLIRVLKY